MFGAVVGAIIAGGIGIAGQLLVIVQGEIKFENEARLLEKAKLEALLGRVVRIISTFAQVRTHLESTDHSDNIVFSELQMLPKPLKINDLPAKFSSAELTVPLGMSDRRFFNLLNVLDSIIGNFVWAHREYEAKVEVFLLDLQGADKMRFIEGKFSGYGQVNMVHYHVLKDLSENTIDSVYPGLVVAKRISEILVDHLRERHGVNLSFSDRISTEDWQTLFESVDLGDFGEDIV